MRTCIGAAVLAVAIGFSLQASAAPILATGTSTTVGKATPSYFQPLSLPSFLTSTSKFSSFFPAMPSIANPTGRAFSGPIPLTNGQANADYFKAFHMQAAPRVH